MRDNDTSANMIITQGYFFPCSALLVTACYCLSAIPVQDLGLTHMDSSCKGTIFFTAWCLECFRFCMLCSQRLGEWAEFGLLYTGMTGALPVLHCSVFAGGGWCIWRKGTGAGIAQAPKLLLNQHHPAEQAQRV